MTATIYTEELISSIRDKFLLELAAIPDEVAAKRSGIEVKEGEIERAVVTADATLRQSVIRFLEWGDFNGAENGTGIPETFEYKFSGSDRRFSGKMQMLTDQIHAALVDVALSLLFIPLNVDLRNKYDALAYEDVNNIVSALYTKRPPRV